MDWALLLMFISIISILQADPAENTDTTRTSITNNSEDCCDFKMVGGVQYIKISRGAVAAQCKTDCIYERKDKPSSRFCFARGKLEMHCMDGGQDTKEWSIVDEISWLTKHSLEVRFSDNSTQRILLNPVNSSETASGGVCVFTGVLENDQSSAVEVSGCRDEHDINITITSNRFKEGVVFINIYEGKKTEKEIHPYSYEDEMLMAWATQKKIRKTMAISLWPNKVLWYDLTDIGGVWKKQQIRNVLNELARNVNIKETCIQFKEKNTGNRVKVTNKQVDETGKKLPCSSNVGYIRRGDQRLNLNNDCINIRATIQHEFFHALGIIHTQQRPDRDNFVTLEKTRPGFQNWFRTNYGKCENCNTYGIPYDYESVMHYPSSSTIRIQTLDPSKQILIGKSNTASPNDLEMVRRMYCGTQPPAFVSCGGQYAPSCGDCLSSCDGDCGFHNGQCKALVSCGNHKKVTCGECPQDNGASWCNGDCTWLNGQCKDAHKSCGGHFVPTCEECGPNPSYCNGDCAWTNGGCTEVPVSGVLEPCTCQDHPGYQNNCPWWRSHCNGGNYQDWVTTRCPATCNNCQCCDERRDLVGSISCANWKMMGFCSHTWVNWMWVNCYKTCSSDECNDCEPRSNNDL